MVLDTYPFEFTAAAGPRVHKLPAGGFFMLCTRATQAFRISIDGSPLIPFGVGQSIAPKNPDGTPARFNYVEIYNETGAFVDNSFELLVGNVDFRGALGIAAGQYFRPQGAALMTSSNQVWANGGLGVHTVVALGLKVFKVNVRNTDATRTLRVAMGLNANAQFIALAAGAGYILDPGENADFDVAPSSLGWTNGIPFMFGGVAGQTFTVSAFQYE